MDTVGVAGACGVEGGAGLVFFVDAGAGATVFTGAFFAEAAAAGGAAAGAAFGAAAAGDGASAVCGCGLAAEGGGGTAETVLLSLGGGETAERVSSSDSNNIVLSSSSPLLFIWRDAVAFPPSSCFSVLKLSEGSERRAT